MHASAPEGHRCADCTMDKEPCPLCYEAAWKKRHPNTLQLPDRSATIAAQAEEIKRLNKWPDGMTDIAMKERATGEAYQRELRAQIELLKVDAERLNWMELKYVVVRDPLRYGSRAMFATSPDQMEGCDDQASDLRKRIDAARSAKEPT